MKITTQKKKIIIIGAGPGGLTSAMILANRGFDVHVYEKENKIGGRNSEIVKDGFTFDVGPTFLMLKFILDEMFIEAGADSESLLKFTRLDPMYRLKFQDFNIDISDDAEKMKKEIGRLFPGEETGLDLFFKKEAKRFEKLYPCMQKPYNSFWSLLNPIFIKALPHLPIGTSIFDYLGKYFNSEKLRLAFTFQAKYLGMSPFECPAFFIMLPFIEHRFGIFHVEGGLSQISKKMAEIATLRGAVFHLNSPVKQILFEGKKAIGVELHDGTKDFADRVIINADFAHAITTLVPGHLLKKYSKEKVEKKSYSCSTFMLYLGLDQEYPEMKHHTILFADNYRKNIDHIFKSMEVSEDFSLYIRNATITDKSVAPRGMSNMYVLVPMPNNKSGIDWESEKTKVRDEILSMIEKRTEIKNIRDHIVTEHMITPLDWEKSGVYKGAVFNLTHSLNQLLMFRPHNKFEELDNVFIVGGGTHPGSGLPTIYESGRIAANMICDEFNIPYKKPRKLSDM